MPHAAAPTQSLGQQRPGKQRRILPAALRVPEEGQMVQAHQLDRAEDREGIQRFGDLLLGQFKLTGGDAPGDTGTTVPLWVALLVPYFNNAGWYSGISFQDAMHFEVADGTIRKWQQDGLLGASGPTQPIVVAGDTSSPGPAPVNNPPPAFGGGIGSVS